MCTHRGFAVLVCQVTTVYVLLTQVYLGHMEVVYLGHMEVVYPGAYGGGIPRAYGGGVPWGIWRWCT